MMKKLTLIFLLMALVLFNANAKNLNTSNYETLVFSNCDDNVGWSGSNLTVDTDNKVEGLASLSATDPNTTFFEFKPGFTLDISSYTDFVLDVYIENTDIFSIDSQIEIGSGDNPDVEELNWFREVYQGQLVPGWNTLRFKLSSGNRDAAFNDKAVKRFRFYAVHNSGINKTMKIDNLRFERQTFSGGSGTLADPYQVATCADFDNIRNYRDKYFKLITDLDFTGFVMSQGYSGEDASVWWPVGEWGSGDGSEQRFRGVFDGNYHTIRNLVVTRTAYDLSIFGVIENATIKNLVVENCEIYGEGRLGVVTGGTFNSEITQVAVINSKCYNNQSSNGFTAAGITGPLYNNSKVNNCYVRGGVIYGKIFTGGISSNIEDGGGEISYSYSTCAIDGVDQVGSITGNNDNGSVKNCIALNSTIIGSTDYARVVGRLQNSATLTNVYAGDFVQLNGAPVTDNIGTTSINGANAASAQTTSIDFYKNVLGFDENIWTIDTSVSQYPIFKWQVSGFSTSTSAPQSDKHKILLNNRILQISGLSAGEQVRIYNISGKLIGNRAVNGEQENFNMNDSGIYIVNIISKTSIYNYKVMVK